MPQLTVDKRLKTLYLGLDPSNYQTDNLLIHSPIIEVRPKKFEMPEIAHVIKDAAHYSHIIFTSKKAVSIFFQALTHHGLSVKDLANADFVVIGRQTALALENQGVASKFVASMETQEGIIELLKKESLENAYICLPCSSLARPCLAQFLIKRRLRHQLCFIYDTVTGAKDPLVDIDEIDEIVFTSPSTVDAFLELYGPLPVNKILTPIGPVTKHRIECFFQ
ncbi:MAG: uroporphyrinogen-III synthase [Simkaniaceae bacterium]|nr:uroporphyrinogen-III synthase [Simkaniaceae bacterium]